MWGTLFAFCQIVLCFIIVASMIGMIICGISFVANGEYNPWKWETEARGIWIVICVAAGAILTAAFASNGI